MVKQCVGGRDSAPDPAGELTAPQASQLDYGGRGREGEEGTREESETTGNRKRREMRGGEGKGMGVALNFILTYIHKTLLK